MPDPEELNSPLEEQVLCPQCGELNDLDAQFCSKCQQHISRHGTIDPLKSIWVQGDLFRNLSKRTKSRTAMIGALLILVGLLGSGLIALYVSLRDQKHSSSLAGMDLSSFLQFVLVVAIAGFFIYQSIKARASSRR